MDLHEELLDLETAVIQISRGVKALEVMSMGLPRTLDPYADGLDAICDYLSQANQDLQRRVDACLKAV